MIARFVNDFAADDEFERRYVFSQVAPIEVPSTSLIESVDARVS